MPAPTRILVFAKAPLPGLAKTRLIPALGAQGAADLAGRLLRHAVAQARASGIGPVSLCVAPGPLDAAWAGHWPDATLEGIDQGEGDLGERMARAAQRALAEGPVLLMGTDCPGLNAERLQAAARALHSADACLVPALDGGYVLLGLQRFDAAVFEGIAWSTASVAQATRERLQRLNWRWQELPALHDIDEPQDLRWLPAGWQAAR
jgi:rSAM/selenodomain-associated transferase 1